MHPNMTRLTSINNTATILFFLLSIAPSGLNIAQGGHCYGLQTAHSPQIIANTAITSPTITTRKYPTTVPFLPCTASLTPVSFPLK